MAGIQLLPSLLSACFQLVTIRIHQSGQIAVWGIVTPLCVDLVFNHQWRVLSGPNSRFSKCKELSTFVTLIQFHSKIRTQVKSSLRQAFHTKIGTG